jgi:hypothetical protein
MKHLLNIYAIDSLVHFKSNDGFRISMTFEQWRDANMPGTITLNTWAHITLADSVSV